MNNLLLSKKVKSVQRLQNSQSFLMCPICHSSMAVSQSGITCSQNHHFDITRKGHVNFSLAKGDKGYDYELFDARKMMIQAGLFNNLIDEITQIINLKSTHISSFSLLDAGCGEGNFLIKLLHGLNHPFCHVFGVDLAKDAITLATNENSDVNWMVADLAKLPIQSNVIDVVLNVLSPANYDQFKRVLKEEGLCIKVVPNSEHFKQLREALGMPYLEANHAQQTIAYFKENMVCESEISVSYDFALEENHQKMIQLMSPLSKHSLNNSSLSISHITIDVVILVANT